MVRISTLDEGVEIARLGAGRGLPCACASRADENRRELDGVFHDRRSGRSGLIPAGGGDRDHANPSTRREQAAVQAGREDGQGDGKNQADEDRGELAHAW